MSRCKWLAMVGMLWATPAIAITVDGVKDGDYGAAIAVQAVQTQFGDQGGCPIDQPDCGGELDAVYAKFVGDRLYLMVTGNLEADSFNKLEIFFDSVAGGENQLSNLPQYDFNDNGTWISTNMGGMKFDTGVTADYHMFARGGFGNFEVDFVDRQGGTNMQVPGASAGAALTGTAGAQTAVGSVPAGGIGPNALVSSLTQSLDFGFDNSNTAGVSGGTGAADQVAAAAVTTGAEFSIALADIGNPAVDSTIKIAIFYGNGNHNYISNQALGSFTPPQANAGPGGNPGEPTDTAAFTGNLALMDFSAYAGNQYIELTVPMVTGMPGDYNGDTVVDGLDYALWRNNLGAPTEASINDNGDGLNGVDEEDFNLWKLHYGDGSGPGAGGSAVPEPASAMALVLGLLVVGATRRRR